MLYYLKDYEELFGPLRLFSFVTFRAAGAAFTSLLLAVALGPLTVRVLTRLNASAPLRLKDLVPDEQLDYSKEHTPSMGGVLIILSIVVAAMLWGNPGNPILLVFLGTLLALGGLGFLDDYSKVVLRRRDGISARLKIAFQCAIALCAVTFVFSIPTGEPYMWTVMVPFLKDPVLTGAVGASVALALGILAVIGASNAVNITDGKDGLAVGCMIFAALAYAAFAYLCGHRIFAEHLHIPYIPGAGEVGVFASAIAGVSIGFLWYNCHPASMFMGDTGSLALGGTIALVAVLVKQELTLIIVGGVFVMECISVMLQVLSYKTRGKRIFLRAPIHDHFERKGWRETQIVVRFWILAGIFALCALLTLKIR
ncbi:MAG: phospho-N-acetylmuramoyl-pentapeptide-transferase [Victivallales bacterium]|nr:phospho-N-acetylmuramoyl-pentapeptide-transferase [Victivallales bacterium]